MPQLSLATHILEDGSANPDVGLSHLGIAGNGLSAGILITVTCAQSESFQLNPDASGNINASLLIQNADSQVELTKFVSASFMGSGPWNVDSGSLSIAMELV